MPRKVRKSLKHGNSSKKTKILNVFFISRYTHDGISSNTTQDSTMNISIGQNWLEKNNIKLTFPDPPQVGSEKIFSGRTVPFLSIPSVQVKNFDTKDLLCAKFLT